MQNFKLTKKNQKKPHRQKEIENGRKVKMIAIEHYEVASVLYISTFWNSLYNMQIYIYMHGNRYDTYQHEVPKNMNMFVFNFQITKVMQVVAKQKKQL